MHFLFVCVFWVFFWGDLGLGKVNAQKMAGINTNWTLSSKILQSASVKIHENWLQGWYSCERK